MPPVLRFALDVFSLRLAQPHTRASAAVLIDEHNTSGLQRAAADRPRPCGRLW
jgi:hypothetical protein